MRNVASKSLKMIKITALVPFILLFTAYSVGPSHASCKVPPPSSNFTLQRYYGLWYEIGKIQTPGGAAFEKDCVCTTIEVEAKKGETSVGDSTALNSCRKLTPTGKYLNATGNLIDMIKPGQWKEKFFVFTPAVNYTVIYIDDEFAIEYDCGESFGFLTNYCIHIMARSPTADPDKVKSLEKFALDLGLNTDNLPFQWTKQDSCW